MFKLLTNYFIQFPKRKENVFKVGILVLSHYKNVHFDLLVIPFLVFLIPVELFKI